MADQPVKQSPKAKGAGSKPKRRGRKPSDRGAAPPAIVLRGFPEWEDWLRQEAKDHWMTPTAVIDQALAEWAEKRGRTAPPQRTN